METECGIRRGSFQTLTREEVPRAMHTIVADDSMRAVFSSITELTEVRDPSGEVLGYFAPAGDEEALLYAKAFALFDPAEMERRRRTKSRDYTIEEVRAHLRSLEEH